MKVTYDLCELDGHEFEVLEDSGAIVDFDMNGNDDQHRTYVDVNSVMFNGEDVTDRLTEHEIDSIKDHIANGEGTLVDDDGNPLPEPWSPTGSCLYCKHKRICKGNCHEPQKRED